MTKPHKHPPRAAWVLAAALIPLLLILLLFRVDTQVHQENLRFLRSYGWTVDETPIEILPTLIPRDFDRVYEAYNALIAADGFDLAPYRGKAAIRYTYRVTNHVESAEGTVFIHLSLVQNKIVAADLAIRRADGALCSIGNRQGQLTVPDED